MADYLTTRRADVLGGTPVFAGTRVPVRYLFDWLESGETLEWFLDSYPSPSDLARAGDGRAATSGRRTGKKRA